MRGYQKRVIYVKNTGSRHFEEAYFVVRPDARAECLSNEKMIEEANRIINENIGAERGGFIYSKRWYFLTFALGACVSFALSLVFGIIY